MPLTKSQFINEVFTRVPRSGSKAIVAEVLTAVAKLVTEQLKSEGIANVPGLAKFKTVERKAQPERQGINPFTKAPITIKAKEATKKVKASPAKTIKEAVSG